MIPGEENCRGDGSENFAMLIVSNSVIVRSPDGEHCSGDPVIDGGHNLEDVDTCGCAGPSYTTTGGTSFCTTAPGLAAGLADNGGPTQTLAVLAGSPAINAGAEAADVALAADVGA